MRLPHELEAAVRFYLAYGFDPIPLISGTKRPSLPGWPDRAPHEQWQDAPPGANIGLRCAGRLSLAVLDCDDDIRHGTLANVMTHLAGLGLRKDYPTVQTASGVGRHIYVSVLDPPPGHYRLISSELGAGEVRYGPAAQVVAPPSIVGTIRYRLLSGDLRYLPSIRWRDLVPILDTT